MRRTERANSNGDIKENANVEETGGDQDRRECILGFIELASVLREPGMVENMVQQIFELNKSEPISEGGHQSEFKKQLYDPNHPQMIFEKGETDNPHRDTYPKYYRRLPPEDTFQKLTLWRLHAYCDMARDNVNEEEAISSLSLSLSSPLSLPCPPVRRIFEQSHNPSFRTYLSPNSTPFFSSQNPNIGVCWPVVSAFANAVHLTDDLEYLYHFLVSQPDASRIPNTVFVASMGACARLTESTGIKRSEGVGQPNSATHEWDSHTEAHVSTTLSHTESTTDNRPQN